jgi:hypothetical protein
VRRRDHRRRFALDLDSALAVSDLDLGQLVVSQQLRELADQRRVDPHRAAGVVLWGARLGRLGHSLFPY